MAAAVNVDQIPQIRNNPLAQICSDVFADSRQILKISFVVQSCLAVIIIGLSAPLSAYSFAAIVIKGMSISFLINAATNIYFKVFGIVVKKCYEWISDDPELRQIFNNNVDTFSTDKIFMKKVFSVMDGMGGSLLPLQAIPSDLLRSMKINTIILTSIFLISLMFNSPSSIREEQRERAREIERERQAREEMRQFEMDFQNMFAGFRLDFFNNALNPAPRNNPRDGVYVGNVIDRFLNNANVPAEKKNEFRENIRTSDAEFFVKISNLVVLDVITSAEAYPDFLANFRGEVDALKRDYQAISGPEKEIIKKRVWENPEWGNLSNGARDVWAKLRALGMRRLLQGNRNFTGAVQSALTARLADANVNGQGNVQR